MTSEDRTQAKAKRDKAIKLLRETGMTDQEIANQLGLENLDQLASMSDSNERVGADGIQASTVAGMNSATGAEGCASSAPEPQKPRASSNDLGKQADSIKPRQWTELWWEQARPEVQARRCKAHRKNGSRCLKAAIEGAVVCRTHGGATGHIKRAARARLENAADRMAKELLGIAIDPKTSDAVKLKAITAALDRAGIKPTTEVVVSAGNTSGFDEVFGDVFTGSRAESRRARGMELGPNDLAALQSSGNTQSEASTGTIIDVDSFDIVEPDAGHCGPHGYPNQNDASGPGQGGLVSRVIN